MKAIILSLLLVTAAQADCLPDRTPDFEVFRSVVRECNLSIDVYRDMSGCKKFKSIADKLLPEFGKFAEYVQSEDFNINDCQDEARLWEFFSEEIAKIARKKELLGL